MDIGLDIVTTNIKHFTTWGWKGYGVVLFFFPSGRAGWGRRVLGGGEKRRGREPV